MPNEAAVAALLLELFDRGLNMLIKYQAIQKQAQAEGRSVNMDDVRILQAELKRNQAELDNLIDGMPESSND